MCNIGNCPKTTADFLKKGGQQLQTMRLFAFAHDVVAVISSASWLRKDQYADSNKALRLAVATMSGMGRACHTFWGSKNQEINSNQQEIEDRYGDQQSMMEMKRSPCFPTLTALKTLKACQFELISIIFTYVHFIQFLHLSLQSTTIWFTTRTFWICFDFFYFSPPLLELRKTNLGRSSSTTWPRPKWKPCWLRCCGNLRQTSMWRPWDHLGSRFMAEGRFCFFFEKPICEKAAWF